MDSEILYNCEYTVTNDQRKATLKFKNKLLCPRPEEYNFSHQAILFFQDLLQSKKVKASVAFSTTKLEGSIFQDLSKSPETKIVINKKGKNHE